MHADPPVVVDNTCCPVCGAGVSSHTAPIEVRPHDTSFGVRVLVRVDSSACAKAVRQRPEHYLPAAQVNQVAH